RAGRGLSSGMRMPPLETERLVVREFTPDDLAGVHRLLDVELAAADFGTEGPCTLADRRRWLTWTVLGYGEHARLAQPPYGERAVVRRDTGELVGACGLVPCLAPFGLLPGFSEAGAEPPPGAPAGAPARAEVGLYYAVAPAHQRQGFA